MADDVDISNNKSEALRQKEINRIREQAAQMPVGNPGKCEVCENESPRLVNGICPPCRDKYGLP